MDLIEDVKNQILRMEEVEMGDFRRRAVLYINRLEEHIHKDQKNLAKVREIREKALYKEFEDTEDLRQLIMDGLNQLSFLLNGIKK